MSATTDRLTKLRNLASHPATPPAEAAAARGKIADIEARNPELKAKVERGDGEPRREDFDSWDDYKRATIAWILRGGKPNSHSTSEAGGSQWNARPDPFRAWADMNEQTAQQAHPYCGDEDAARKRRSAEKARIVATRTYPQIAQQLHEYGIDMPPHVWNSFLYDILQSR